MSLLIRITLASIFLVILILDKFNYHGGRWTARLCKLNILVIGASLMSIKYKASQPERIQCNIPLFQFIPGILPAVFITGVDVIFCSIYSLRYFSSLLLNSLKGILALFVAAVAMIYGEALLYFLRKNNVL